MRISSSPLHPFTPSPSTGLSCSHRIISRFLCVVETLHPGSHSGLTHRPSSGFFVTNQSAQPPGKNWPLPGQGQALDTLPITSPLTSQGHPPVAHFLVPAPPPVTTGAGSPLALQVAHSGCLKSRHGSSWPVGCKNMKALGTGFC